MNGLLNLVNTENVIDATDTGLTEDLLLDALQKMWDHGAQGEYFTFVNATVKRLINKLAKSGDNIRFVKGDEGVGKALVLLTIVLRVILVCLTWYLTVM